MNKKLIIVFLSLLTLVAVFLFVTKPYETLSEERISGQLKSINAVYVNYTGDDLCAKLYRYEGNNPANISTPVFMALPQGLISPEDDKSAYANNLYRIQGYEYQFVMRNALTGTRKMSPSHQFDVVGWEVIPPYKVWTDKTDKDGMLIVETKNSPYQQKLVDDNHEAINFNKRNYIDCSK